MLYFFVGNYQFAALHAPMTTKGCEDIGAYILITGLLAGRL